MKMLKLSAAVSALFLMSGAAHSADLYTPPPMPAYTGGWYFSAFGGANWLDDTSFNIDPAGPAIVDNDYDTGFVVGGAIGYDVDSIDRCNTLGKLLSWGLILQGPAWSFVQLPCNRTQLSLRMNGQVSSSGQILP
jgi:hypothetical protein